MAGKLKPLDVARQVTPGKYPDGDGLYLIVAGETSRNWSYRYWINGRERWQRPRLAAGRLSQGRANQARRGSPTGSGRRRHSAGEARREAGDEGG